MQATLTHQKNQEASMRNLETQVGQLAKQMADQQGGQFSANTQTNPKEQCKAITIWCGKKVGSDVNEEANENRDEQRRKSAKAENVAEASEDRPVTIQANATVETSSDTESSKAGERPGVDSGKKQPTEGQNWRMIKEGIPIKNVPYPHAPSRKEVQRQFIRFTQILKNLQIIFLFLRHYSRCLPCSVHEETTHQEEEISRGGNSGVGGRL